MAINAEDIHNVSFSIDRKGYDVDEVDVFLEHVADEIDIMNQRIAALVEELDAKEAELAVYRTQEGQPAPAASSDADEAADQAQAPADSDDASAEVAALRRQVADLQSRLDEKAADDAAISQALIVAQRSADEILSNARSESSNIIKDADEEADRIVSKAEADRLKIMESIRTLEADRSDVRAEYRDMLANFMADAQKKLAEIDGDARRASVTAQARAEANAAVYEAVPAASQAASAPAFTPVTSSTAPSASGYIDKDLSGFGAADSDFAFDDID